MWWQVLPPLAIMGGCVGVLYSGQGFVRYLFQGQPYNRNLSECTHYDPYQRLAFKRDAYMTGNFYEYRGLDCIPDED